MITVTADAWRERGRRLLLPTLIVLTALVVRAVYLWQLGATPFGFAAIGPDVQEYDAMAREVLGGGWLGTGLRPHAPLYPYVLAGLYALTGQQIMVVRACQLGLDVAALLLVMTGLRWLGRPRTALLTGVLWALYLPLVYYSAEILSEGLLVFCVSLAFVAGVATWRLRAQGGFRMATVTALATGLCLGCAAITHPLCLAAVGAVLLAAALYLPRLDGRMRGWRVTVALAVGIVLPILPVAALNYVASGDLVFIQGRSGFNLYIGNNPDANGACYLRPGGPYEAVVRRPLERGLWRESEVSRFYRAEVLAFIREHPGDWLRLLGRKLLLTWSAADIPSGADLPQVQSATALMRSPLLHFGLVFPLALAGLLALRRRPELAICLLWIAGYALALTATVTSGRYRLGLTPAVLVLAATALDEALEWLRSRHLRRLVPAAAACVAGGVVAFVPSPPAVVDPAEYPLTLAASALIRQDAAGVEMYARQALCGGPLDGAAEHFLGLAADLKGDTAAAEAHFRRALTLSAHDVATRGDYAIFLSDQGRRAEARREFGRALQDAPGAGSIWYNLGVVEQAEDNLVLAADHYTRALRNSPAQASAHLNLGLYLQATGQAAEAEQHLRRAVRLAPHKLNALNAYAVFLADQGRKREAVSWFERSLELDPRQVSVWILYASFMESTAGNEKAMAVIDRARRLNPTAQELWPQPPPSPGAAVPPSSPASQSPSAPAAGPAAP